jgi:chromosome segregation ATPase
MNEVQNQLEKEKEINEIKDINILKLEEEIELQRNDKARLEKNIEEISEKFDAEKLNAEKFLQKFEAEKENVQVLIMKIEALEQHLKKDIKGDNDSVNEIDVKVKLEDEDFEKNVKLELLEDEKVVQESSQLIIDELREEIRFLTEQLDAETKTNEMSINKIQELELEIQEINWKYHQFTDEPLEFQLENEKFKIISLQETIESLNLDLETSEKIQSELTSKIMDLECNSSLAQESQLYLQNSELNETIEKLKEELESLYEIQKSLNSKNSELEGKP